jgi:hypothetical protein
MHYCGDEVKQEMKYFFELLTGIVHGTAATGMFVGNPLKTPGEGRAGPEGASAGGAGAEQ